MSRLAGENNKNSKINNVSSLLLLVCPWPSESISSIIVLFCRKGKPCHNVRRIGCGKLSDMQKIIWCLSQSAHPLPFFLQFFPNLLRAEGAKHLSMIGSVVGNIVKHRSGWRYLSAYSTEAPQVLAAATLLAIWLPSVFYLLSLFSPRKARSAFASLTSPQKTKLLPMSTPSVLRQPFLYHWSKYCAKF